MQPELAKLAQLQEVEHQAAALTAQIAAYPKKIAARETALNATNRELQSNALALANQSSTRRRMESDTQDLRQKATRYRAQLEDVQSDSQMKALEHQLAFCKQEIDRIEELEFVSLVETETLETRQRTLDETIANQKLALDSEKADAALGRERDAAQLQELMGERATLRTSIEARLLAEYDRISAAGKAAIARVEGQRCSACQMMVRPQRWNEIREGAVHFCESCGRFLFYDPAVDLSDAMHLPPAGKKQANPAKASSQAQAAAANSGNPVRED